MKKLFLIFLCIFSINIQNVTALETEDIKSNEAVVFDVNTDKVLFSKNTTDESVSIASLTKLMTYVLTIENTSDLINTKIVVPNGTEQNVINQGASKAGLKDGYEYSIIDLLYGLMLPSGCDAADVLALYISNNDYNKFIEMMNDKAKELGMNNTIFYTASGLEDNGNYNLSTEQDLYKLAKYVFNLPYFEEIIGTEYYTIHGYKNDNIVEKLVQNTNSMIGEINGAEYYHQYSLGGKTGYLSNAGKCLISYVQKGELEIIVITLGVPNTNDNYHFEDHKNLIDYTFMQYTENISIDIGTLYKSVGVGEKIKITPITEDTKIVWSSSDETVATVNEYGIVTGKKIGQAKIIATTSTGNKAYAYVSVGYYNGIDIKYSHGPINESGKYEEIDWSIIKSKGIDFAVIRAGYALNNNPDSDPFFISNIQGAHANNINIMISFDSYATNEEYATKEAEYLINYLNENIFEYLSDIKLPIVYNLVTSPVTDIEELTKIILAFKNKMIENGYEIIIELKRDKLSTINLDIMNENNIGIYVNYRPYVPDFQNPPTFMYNEKNYNADLWFYRGDGYLGDVGIGHKVPMSALYMDYKIINTSHEIYDESLYSKKPELKIEETYVYNGKEITASVLGFDSNTMEITGNVAKNVGTYSITVKPKVNWQDGSNEEVTIMWQIEKATPEIEIPQLKTKNNSILNDIKLPDNFYWKNPNEIVNVENDNKFIALYIPTDLNNYNVIEIELTVEIEKEEIDVINDKEIVNKQPTVNSTIKEDNLEIEQDTPEKIEEEIENNDINEDTLELKEKNNMPIIIIGTILVITIGIIIKRRFYNDKK